MVLVLGASIGHLDLIIYQQIMQLQRIFHHKKTIEEENCMNFLLITTDGNKELAPSCIHGLITEEVDDCCISYREWISWKMRLYNGWWCAGIVDSCGLSPGDFQWWYLTWLWLDIVFHVLRASRNNWRITVNNLDRCAKWGWVDGLMGDIKHVIDNTLYYWSVLFYLLIPNIKETNSEKASTYNH